MMDMMNFGHGWSMGSSMWILPILFWGLIIAGIVFIAHGLTSQKRQQQDSALTILQKRYAKGEIDQDTFKRMKQELEDKG